MNPRQTTVFTFLDGTFVPAGLLKFFAAGRRSYSVFRYGRKYLQRVNAQPVDPVQLPLSKHELYTPQGFDLFNGIRDAGPDRWGRYLIERRLPGPLDEIDYICEASGDRSGALAFSPSPQSYPATVSTRLDLEDCLGAIDSVTQGTDSAELAELLNYGPSLGGARPKANVSFRRRLYLAKFSVSFDRRDEPTLEYATMKLARKVGVNVPPIELETVVGRKVFLIERFDRSGNLGSLQPIPFMSGLSATGLHESDYNQWSYRSLCEAIDRFSEEPVEDKKELFRRMVFNIIVHNNDDHMRNHGFLGTTRHGWRLSPLYDVVPGHAHGESYHLALRVGQQGSLASFANALTSAPDFGLAQREAQAIIDTSVVLTRNWASDFSTNGVDEGEIQRLRGYIKVK